jgi:pilus assembly protein CpaC
MIGSMMRPLRARTLLAAGVLALAVAVAGTAAAQNGPAVQPLSPSMMGQLAQQAAMPVRAPLPQTTQPVVFPVSAPPAVQPFTSTASGETETRIIKIAAAAEGAPQHISLALNKAAVIELDTDARDVFVANPQIVDAVVRTPRRIFLMSLKLGQTNAIFLDGAGKHIATLEIVVGSDVADLNNQLKREMPDSKIHAEALNDNVVLTGTVNSVQDASYAQDMAVRFTGAPEKVVNRLSIGQRQQVLIRVHVAEMNRSIAKQFGTNVQAAVGQDSSGVPYFFGTDNQFNLLGRALADLSGARVGSIGAICMTTFPCNPTPNNIQGILRALEQIGLVHTMAEPNLTAVSGESAKFLAGGEFPVPTSRDRDGNVMVTFKQFGVGLAFTPLVLGSGRISLQISSEVSELSTQGAFLINSGSNGLQIPGLTVRRTETTVEMPSGGSLVIGGLLQQQTKQVLDAFPGLKELPVLGGLFRSRDFQNNESELVVMVTAYLVDPVPPTQLTTPDAGYAVPTDLETIFLGRVNAVYGKDAKLPSDVPKDAIGYIVQ